MPSLDSYSLNISANNFVIQSIIYDKVICEGRVNTMSQDIDLKEKKRRAYRAYNESGLPELYDGLTAVLSGVVMLQRFAQMHNTGNGDTARESQK